MPNGTLEDHLHKLGTPLTWLQRFKICIGAGRGLHYLHTGTGIESGIIHRDVKSSNILLHQSWAAKISDFGLSKIGPTNQPTTFVNTLVKGTFGYLDPDYYATGKLTRKSDVYAFGVVMLELLCRRRALDRSLSEEQMNLARWVQESVKEGNLKQIVDSDIRGEIAPKCLKGFVRIAERCLHTNTKQRSTMAQVLVGLENVLILQEKYNNSLQPAGRRLLGRMVNMLHFSSNGEDSAQGRLKLSSDNKGNSGMASNTIRADNNTTSLDTIDVKLSSDNKGDSGKVSNVIGAGNNNTSLDTIDVKQSSDNKGDSGMASNTIRADNTTTPLDTIDVNLSSDDKGDSGRASNIIGAGNNNMARDTVDAKLSSDNKGNSGRASNIIGADNKKLLDTIDSKHSSDNKGNSGRAGNIIGADKKTLLDTTEHPADYRILSLQKFEIDVLRKYTNDFSQDTIIGEGDFETIYLGWVNENTFSPSKHGDGVAIAVKRLHCFQEHAEWQKEVSFLGQLAHPNIVTLLGYCSDDSQQCLVFEYMPNKSFDRFIFTDIPNHIAEPLSWRTRLMTMIGVARGLVYLHSLNEKFIQCDLKSANIFLDEDFNAKLGGISYLNFIPWDGKTHVNNLQSIRTYGYIDPAYVGTGYLSVKSDIYSFGVVLLEALTGQRVIDRKRHSKQQNLVDWARLILGKRKMLKKIMDPRLEQNYPVEGAFDCASLALRCLASYSKDRPSSEEVLQSLEQILSNSMTA